MVGQRAGRGDRNCRAVQARSHPRLYNTAALSLECREAMPPSRDVLASHDEVTPKLRTATPVLRTRGTPFALSLLALTARATLAASTIAVAEPAPKPQAADV